MNKQIIYLSSLIFTLLLFPSLVRGADLEVVCATESEPCVVTPSNSPLFNADDLLPGDSMSKEIAVTNNSSDGCTLNLDVQNVVSSQNNVEDRLFNTISSSSIANESLSDLDNDTISLGSISSGETNLYTWDVVFDLEAGNEFVDSSTSFDFDLVFNCTSVSTTSSEGQVAGIMDTNGSDSTTGRVLGAIKEKVPRVLGITSFPKTGLPVVNFFLFLVVGTLVLVPIVKYLLPLLNRKSPRG